MSNLRIAELSPAKFAATVCEDLKNLILYIFYIQIYDKYSDYTKF